MGSSILENEDLALVITTWFAMVSPKVKALDPILVLKNALHAVLILRKVANR